MGWLKHLPPLMITGICGMVWAQSPNYGLGRTPSAEEIRAWDISIGPAGKELPPGRGTAKEGAQVFVQKGCSACHGATGMGGRAPALVKSPPPPPGQPPQPPPPGMEGMHMVPDTGIMALRSPYAVTLWDYINRGMPLGREGTLKPDEVYALTAFLLYKNEVIPQEDQVIDAQSLPKVKMPNENGFVLPPDWKHGTPRLKRYP